jgi:23S rRNA pseudouridine1911/1915/1917 synthase
MDVLKTFKRQALHAGHLELIHPQTGEMESWDVEIPDDMEQLIEVMHQDVLEHGVNEEDY